MRRSIVFGLILFMLFLSMISVSAQKQAQKSRPTFDGEWIIDPKRSGMNPVGGDERLRMSSGETFRCEDNLSIRHQDPTFEIIRTATCKKGGSNPTRSVSPRVYFTDSRGETNQTFDNDTIESVTNWDNDRLVIVYYKTDKKGKKTPSVSLRYDLSKSGDELTNISRPGDPRHFSIHEHYTTLVYRRK